MVVYFVANSPCIDVRYGGDRCAGAHNQLGLPMEKGVACSTTEELSSLFRCRVDSRVQQRSSCFYICVHPGVLARPCSGLGLCYVMLAPHQRRIFKVYFGKVRSLQYENMKRLNQIHRNTDFQGNRTEGMHIYLPMIPMLHATLTKLLSAAAFWCRGSGRFNQDR